MKHARFQKGPPKGPSKGLFLKGPLKGPLQGPPKGPPRPPLKGLFLNATLYCVVSLKWSRTLLRGTRHLTRRNFRSRGLSAFYYNFNTFILLMNAPLTKARLTRPWLGL